MDNPRMDGPAKNLHLLSPSQDRDEGGSRGPEGRRLDSSRRGPWRTSDEHQGHNPQQGRWGEGPDVDGTEAGRPGGHRLEEGRQGLLGEGQMAQALVKL